MELEDIKDRYKILPMAARLGVALVIGIIPIAYIYLDEGTQLTDLLAEVQGKETQIRASFERARDRKGNLPKLEEQLAFTEEQLNKAKRLLPDSFRIEDILQSVATISREVGVNLNTFTPKEEIKQDIGYPSVEIPIITEITGRFGDVAAFIDRIVRLETAVFVRSIAMTPAPVEDIPVNADPAGKQDYLLAKEARQKAREKAVLTISAYRSQTSAEIAAQKIVAPPVGKENSKPAVDPGSQAHPQGGNGS